MAIETLFLALVLTVGISFVLGFPASFIWETRKLLRVTVHDAAGQPVAGATIWGFTAHLQRPALVVGQIAYLPANAAPPGAARKPVGLTNSEGKWEQTLYYTNPWGLQAEAPDQPPSALAVLRADVKAGDWEEVHFTLSPAAGTALA